MSRDIQATIIHSDSTDMIGAIDRIEEKRKQLTEKEQAVNKARLDLGKSEQQARAGLQRYPALLAEFEAELAELARRREERQAREARIEALRKQMRH